MRKIILSLTMCLILLTGCGNNDKPYTQLINGAIETLDPAQAGSKSTFELFSDIYVGLTRVNADDELENRGATDIQISDDKLTYTIKLRDDIKWVDSTGAEMGNLTAADYEYGFKRIVDPQTASTYSYIYGDIANANAIINGSKDPDTLGIKALDDYTLQVTLDHPVPYFTNLLAFQDLVAQPKAAIEQYGDEYGTSAETTWYSGAYYVSAYDPDMIVEIQKNPLYYDADKVQVETIDYRLSTDDTASYNAVTNGEADYTEIVTAENYTTAKNEGTVHDHLALFSYYFVLNTDPSTPTGDINLRKALSYGFDRDSIVDSVYSGMNKPIEYIIPQGLTNASYDGLDYRDVAPSSLITYDPDKANTYFDKYMTDHNLTERSQIEINYLINDDSVDNSFAEVAQAFYQQEYGITVNLVAKPGKQYSQARREGTFDILMTSWAPDYGDPSTYLALWQSANIGSQNYAQYNSKDYDQLYETANLEQDPTKRFEDFALAEQKLVDDGVLVPLFQLNVPYVLNSDYDYPQYVLFLLSHEYLTHNE